MIACTPGGVTLRTPEAEAEVAGDEEDIPVGDTSVPADTGEPAEETWPGACAPFYDPDVLPSFDLSFSDDEWAGLQNDCRQGVQRYRPASFSWEEESVPAMVRLKGNWSWSCEKLQFVVSFNEEDPEARFHGVRKIVLDAPWYDRTFLHERLAYPVFERLGLPYSCANNARLSIDGSYYAVYANVERIDHEYLERHFEEPDGNLYQGGTELKTNEDVADTTNLVALQSATTIDEIDAVMDLDQAVAEWAAEAMIPAMDNYWAGVEINYYLYDHPSRGFVYLPYDLDISFGDSKYTDGSLVWPDSAWVDPITYEHYGWQKEALAERVLSDRYWCDRFVEELIIARAAYDPAAMSDQAGAWAEQIADAVRDDAHKPFSMADHETAVDELRAFLATRAAFVDAWLDDGDHCPARW